MSFREAARPVRLRWRCKVCWAHVRPGRTICAKCEQPGHKSRLGI